MLPKPNPNDVPGFVDLEGRRWNLIITVGHCEDARKMLLLDLANAHDGRLFTAISDPMTLGSLVWLLVKKQADRLKVSERDFADSLDANACEQATEALTEAIINFTRPSARPAVAKLAAKAKELQARMATATADWIDSEAVEATIEREITKAIENADSMLGKQSTITRESSGSIRNATR